MASTSLHALVSTAAERDPAHPALVFDQRTLSYGSFCKRMWGFADALCRAGVKQGDRVGILMNRSFDSYVAIFGALQAGAVYVPFDVTSSNESVAAILDDCGVRHLIVDKSYVSKLAELGDALERVRTIFTPTAADFPRAHGWTEIAELDAPPARTTVESDLALVFYTSGSTGRPKGVVHSHRSMLSNVEWAVREFALRPGDRFSNVTSHHFDLCWLEMYASFAAGGTVIVAPESTVKFPIDLAKLAAAERMTIWCSVPSTLIGLVERGNLAQLDLSFLRWILFAGERFPVKHLHRLMQQVRGPRYCNMYGTTETHIALFYPVPNDLAADASPLPIGHPCSHVDIAIVDKESNVVPDGEVGELAIRGPSVMDRYWRMPERSQAVLRSVPLADDFAPTFYHTGDLARRDERGDVQLLGRADRRVKVRGYLVDLDEVEKVLLSHSEVKEAAVFCVGEEGVDAHLEGAVIPRSGTADAPSAAALRYHVARVLPAYAVPETLTIAPEFPRTGSGKMDRVSLLRARAGSAVARGLPATRGASRPMTELKEQVTRFIRDSLLDSSTTFDDQTDLLVAGLLDSMSVVRLVAFLETEFGVSVSNSSFVAENFRSISVICEFVGSLKQAEH
jgi:amino acid adenylation domain-containing protein